jgi:hypothetical protein
MDIFSMNVCFSFLQLKLYNTVIDDVIAGVRDAFLDDGVDEQVLQEMKQVWTTKLLGSKAVEIEPSDHNSSLSAKSGSQTKVSSICILLLNGSLHTTCMLCRQMEQNQRLIVMPLPERLLLLSSLKHGKNFFNFKK